MEDLLFELILKWYFSGLCLFGFAHFFDSWYLQTADMSKNWWQRATFFPKKECSSLTGIHSPKGGCGRE